MKKVQMNLCPEKSHKGGIAVRKWYSITGFIFIDIQIQISL